ncbi:hypothetical protein G7Y89_g6801 [Cudoniella acicularis]|uniref:2EXR domain-containing protein n=1 Tax=Cudoniella acicularis TaxID=354080 RepID=A0A8H4RM18_9HELO|nr:hypothetical protein G7Y89_g6801 [Cudoniella acicularis]
MENTELEDMGEKSSSRPYPEDCEENYSMLENPPFRDDTHGEKQHEDQPQIVIEEEPTISEPGALIVKALELHFAREDQSQVPITESSKSKSITQITNEHQPVLPPDHISNEENSIATTANAQEPDMLNRLPFEIRQEIWHLSFPSGRMINVRLKFNEPQKALSPGQQPKPRRIKLREENNAEGYDAEDESVSYDEDWVRIRMECPYPSMVRDQKYPTASLDSPVTLFLNRESREETLRHFKILIRRGGPQKRTVYFNPKEDIVMLGGRVEDLAFDGEFMRLYGADLLNNAE